MHRGGGGDQSVADFHSAARAAHDRGIIYRDLKPQNIMMNKRGDVAQKGRDIARELGYAKRPADTNPALDHRWDFVKFLQAKPEPYEFWRSQGTRDRDAVSF